MKFVAVVGTNAGFSYNRKLLWYMKKRFQNETNVEIEILEIGDLPLFCEDFGTLPDAVEQFAKAVAQSDGVIFATPEYDHAVPASLKSCLEWLSVSALRPLLSQPVMLVGCSLGKLGSVYAQENLRQILASPGLDAAVLSSHQFLLGQAAENFDAAGDLTNPATIAWLTQCFENFQDFAQAMKPLRDKALAKLQAQQIDSLTGASEE